MHAQPAKHAIARAQADTLAARKSRDALKRNGGEQLKALQRQLARLRAEKAALQHELADKPPRLVGPVREQGGATTPPGGATPPGGISSGGDELLQRAAASCASYHQLSIFQQPAVAADAAAAADDDDAEADAAAAAATFERLTAPPSAQLSGLHFLRLPGSPGAKAAAEGGAVGAAGDGGDGARVLDLPGEAALL